MAYFYFDFRDINKQHWHDLIPSLHCPHDVGYDMQVRSGNQAVTITIVSLSSLLASVHRLRRDHHIPFGAYPLLLKEVLAQRLWDPSQLAAN